jgi:uncharacterized membrane protein YtjA (UPF0391 family)
LTPQVSDGTDDAKAPSGNAHQNDARTKGGQSMLYYAVVFFLIALVAAFFGFSGIAAGAASIAKLLFIAFLVLAVVTGIVHILGGARRLP